MESNQLEKQSMRKFSQDTANDQADRQATTNDQATAKDGQDTTNDQATTNVARRSLS